MSYLRIVNRGGIEQGALTLMGASDKRNDSTKIGMFGSGNKYAIATLLRNDIPMVIFNGKEEMAITTEPIKFKTKEFERIVINGEPTSITTDMGHKWEVWQAIRELYSNAIDEGLVSFGLVDDVKPNELANDYTSVFVLNALPIEDMLNNIQDYFAEGKTYLDHRLDKDIGIYIKHNYKVCVYRKNIRCINHRDTLTPSLFDYEVGNINIGEDRIASNIYNVYDIICDLLYSTTNIVIIRNLLENLDNSGLFEYTAIEAEGFYKEDKLSDTWLIALEDRKVCTKTMMPFLSTDELNKCYIVPDNLYRVLVKKFGRKITPISIELSNDIPYIELTNLDNSEKESLSKAIDFFLDNKVELHGKVIVGDFFSEYRDAIVDSSKHAIIIGRNVLGRQVKSIIGVILMYNVAIKYNTNVGTSAHRTKLVEDFIDYIKNKD